MNPDDLRISELEKDPLFKKILMAKKMMVPIEKLVEKIQNEGNFKVSDLVLFLDDN
jgi:hypothetical protein